MEKEILIKNQSGFSLIETIFCLLLTSILTVAGFNILRNHIHLKKVITKDKEAREKADIFFQLLGNYFKQANILYNIEGIKIHPNSKIIDQNNNPAPIGKSNKKIQPNSAADAISFLILNTEAPLENTSINQQLKNLELCLSNSNIKLEDKLKLSNYGYFYALYITGTAEVQGKIKKLNKKSADCKDNYLYTFELINFPKSIFSSKNLNDAPLMIFPIEESFTFYLDNNKTLRRFSLLNGENQPIITKVASFKITAITEDGINKIIFSLSTEGRNSENNIEFKKEFSQAQEFNSSYYDLVL